MDLRLRSKVALVIGGSKKLGRAVVEELAKNGALHSAGLSNTACAVMTGIPAVKVVLEIAA
jgi:NAD(P)-dependent dehydrogenase (short-subunit alcohol dehydrogenase family)